MDPTPQVLIVEEPPKPKFNFRLPKILIIALFVLILIVAIPLVVLFAINKLNLNHSILNPFSQKTQPQLIKQGNVFDLPISSQLSDHPKLFYADLEYDPKTGVVTQLNLGKTNGDVPNYLLKQPVPSADNFVYKIEVISNRNELLQIGWESISKELISTAKGTLKFKVRTIYKPGALIKLYINDAQVWTEKIK